MTSKQETTRQKEELYSPEIMSVYDYIELKKLAKEFNYFLQTLSFINSEFNQVVDNNKEGLDNE